MNTLHRNDVESLALRLTQWIILLALMAVLAACERAEHSTDLPEAQESADQQVLEQQPLGQVVEFEGFSLRANVSRSDALPDQMARHYDIEPEPDLFLLNVVILEDRSDGLPASVAADVNARHESLIGHVEAIDMRAIEADGHVSYIGSLDASVQRVFQIIVEAQPAGADQPLHLSFEVHLDASEFEGQD